MANATQANSLCRIRICWEPKKEPAWSVGIPSAASGFLRPSFTYRLPRSYTLDRPWPARRPSWLVSLQPHGGLRRGSPGSPTGPRLRRRRQRPCWPKPLRLGGSSASPAASWSSPATILVVAAGKNRGPGLGLVHRRWAPRWLKAVEGRRAEAGGSSTRGRRRSRSRRRRASPANGCHR